MNIINIRNPNINENIKKTQKLGDKIKHDPNFVKDDTKSR